MPQARSPNPKRIAIKLQGGIGNQLFQYALGVSLGEVGPFEVCFLGDGFAQDPYGRTSVIERLDPAARIRTSADLLTADSRVLQESHWPGLLDANALLALMNQQQVDTLLLDGYWQNPAYVNGAALTQLREGFARLGEVPASALAEGLAGQIASSPNAVAVHVRRNDYKHHGICRENYYIDSLRWLTAQVPSAEIMVFSDEPNYTGHFLRQAGIAHRLVATGNDLHDLKLMSQCKMHLIANSTYSWWGAYLACTRQVIYPLPWSALHSPPDNFFPAHWLGIENAVSSAIEPVGYQQALSHFDIPAVARYSH